MHIRAIFESMRTCRCARADAGLGSIPCAKGNGARGKSKVKRCCILGCDQPAHARGWCFMHYRRWRLHGDPMLGGYRDKATRHGDPAKFLAKLLADAPSDQCITWPFSCTGNGYGKIWIDGKLRPVHRVICERINGPAPTPDHQSRHSCGNGHIGCVNPRHVRWGTRIENKADELLHGTRNRGRRNGQAKLTVEDVREIRAVDGSMPRHQLGARYGVTASTIYEVVSRQTWAWLDEAAV